MRRSKAERRKGRLIGAAAVLLALVLAGWIYSADYYRAEDAALQALQTDTVLVQRTDYGWFFDGPAEDQALIFYPGAKVEESAYAPLLRSLAEGGLDVCLVKMLLHLAVLDMNAADGIRQQYGYRRWYIGGHSLGGAVAANYAAAHDLDGVILLAAYPTKPVDEPMLLICGTEDAVVDREKLSASGTYGAVTEEEIEGGNHAGFGNYGPQRGDGEAAISPEQQQAIAREAIFRWIG